MCTIEPLSLAQYPSHSLSDQVIVAFASISKLIVLSLRPSMKVLFTHALVGRSDTLPIISWQFVTIQTSNSEKVVDPVIAFGRQSTIYFYQVFFLLTSLNIGCYRSRIKNDMIYLQLSENLSGKTVFLPLQKLELKYDILSFFWLNTRCMAILDTTEAFHLQDIRLSLIHI